METSRNIINKFIIENKLSSGQIYEFLLDYFDEHDLCENLQEYLTFCTEKKDND